MSAPKVLARHARLAALVILGACTGCARVEPSPEASALPAESRPGTTSRLDHAPTTNASGAGSAVRPDATDANRLAAAHSAPDDPPVPSRYAGGALHSPLTPGVAERLQRLWREHPELRDDRFLKVGDSITASHNFMRCVRSAGLDLGGAPALAALVHRLGGAAHGADLDPFRRESRAAGIGWSARAVTADAFLVLAREQRELGARFALVEFGTNDAEDRAPLVFADQMLDIVDWLLARGVVPILFTPPPRRGSVASLWAARYATIVRALAQARQVPLVDYHQAMLGLPRAGLAKDGIHPSVFSGPGGRSACSFTHEGLKHGYNLRNLLALEALGRVLAVAVDGEPPPDPQPPALVGDGSAAAPFLVPELPFVDAATPRASSGALALEVPGGSTGGRGCAEAAQQRHAIHYRISLAERAHVYAFEFDRAHEADLVLIDAAGRCERSEHAIERVLDQGSHELLLIPRESSSKAVDRALVLGAEPASAAALLDRARRVAAEQLR